MNLLQKLDLAILDGLFQKIADWVNNRWGKSCFWLARVNYWIVIIAWAAEIAFYREKLSIHSVFFVLFSIGALWRIGEWEKMEKNPLESAAQRVLNPERISPFSRLIRLFNVFFLPFNIEWFVDFFAQGDVKALLIATNQFAFFCAFYFAACTPKPPSPLKVGNELAVQTSRA